MTTTIYRAEFFTAADYAARSFDAETPEQALQFARQFYDDNLIELDFRSYEDNAGLDQIQIWDNERGTLATWESDDYRVRRAAPDLLAALKGLHDQFACLGMNTSKMPSLQRAKAAITKAKTGGHNDEI